MQDRKGEKGQVWQCVANVLRSHAAAVQLFRQLVPKGKISMALNSDWCEPLTSSAEDQVHRTGIQLALQPALYLQASAECQPVTWQAAAARQMGAPGAPAGLLNMCLACGRQTILCECKTCAGLHEKCDIYATDFMISIFADPIFKGDWPASVKERSPPNLMPITPDLVRPTSRPPSVWKMCSMYTIPFAMK